MKEFNEIIKKRAPMIKKSIIDPKSILSDKNEESKNEIKVESKSEEKEDKS